MSTRAATESNLGSLHEKVAQVLLLTLQNYETRQLIVKDNLAELEEIISNDETGILIGIDITALSKEEVPVPLVMAAISFLKNNDITCVPELNGELGDLKKRLDEKRAKRTVSSIPIEAVLQ